MDKQYPRAPITEAVVEIRLREPLSQKQIEKAHRRLKREFQLSENLVGVALQVELGTGKSTASATPEGFKLTSADGTEVVQARRIGLTCSRLAPYCGWEAFRAIVMERWSMWKDAVDFRPIARLGMRFINRIDIPMHNMERIRIEDYLNLTLHLPDADDTFSFYTLQVGLPVSKSGCRMVVNTGSMPPVLVDHYAVLLDVDVGCDAPPQRDDEIFQTLDEMRVIKNEAFESFITDKTRELFGA